MYSLIRSMEYPELLKRQLPMFLTALVVSELFYKFHSFTLEALAFLATWFVIDAATDLLWRSNGGSRGGRH